MGRCVSACFVYLFPRAGSGVNLIMSDENNNKSSIKGAFTPGKKRDKNVMFLPEEFDIYCNKVTKETFIFHGKDVDYESLERAEYDHKAMRVTIFKTDGSSVDLGVKIQWLIRPYISKAEELQIVQTKDGEAINGTFIPLSHVNAK